MTVRQMRPADSSAVLRIYQDGLDTGLASFETQAPTWPVWNATHLESPRLVFGTRQVQGWVALSPVSDRSAYKGVAETSVYVSADSQGQGIGLALMTALVAASQKAGIWTMQASLFPENTASLKLHQRVGFRVVGRRDKIAALNGVWRDTLLVERRSTL